MPPNEALHDVHERVPEWIADGQVWQFVREHDVLLFDAVMGAESCRETDAGRENSVCDWVGQPPNLNDLDLTREVEAAGDGIHSCEEVFVAHVASGNEPPTSETKN